MATLGQFNRNQVSHMTEQFTRHRDFKRLFKIGAVMIPTEALAVFINLRSYFMKNSNYKKAELSFLYSL